MDCEWDEAKAASNLRKHGVDFADGAGVFDDPLALSMPDDHADEERFIAIGGDFLGRVLVAVYRVPRRPDQGDLGAPRDARRAQRVRGRLEMKREYDFSRAKRGAIIPPAGGKTRITIRIDDDLLDWFRAQVHAQGGGSYQTLINGALREFMARREGALAETLRHVLREELASYLAPRKRGSAKRGMRRRPPA